MVPTACEEMRSCGDDDGESLLDTGPFFFYPYPFAFPFLFSHVPIAFFLGGPLRMNAQSLWFASSMPYQLQALQKFLSKVKYFGYRMYIFRTENTFLMNPSNRSWNFSLVRSNNNSMVILNLKMVFAPSSQPRYVEGCTGGLSSTFMISNTFISFCSIYSTSFAPNPNSHTDHLLRTELAWYNAAGLEDTFFFNFFILII